jgi:AcrR family transcriptional regulator
MDGILGSEHDREVGRRPNPETREALIASGMALFAERGLDGPSLDDICEHAGFTRGAFYVHFHDREDFLVAVMDRVGSAIVEELLAAGSGGLTDAVQRFVAASKAGKYPLMPGGGIRPYQLLDACARSPVLRERYLGLVRDSNSRILTLVREGQEAGVLRKDLDPERAATLLMAIVFGLQTMADLGLDLELAGLGVAVVQLFASGS